MHKTELSGVRVLVTRPAHQAEGLAQRLEQAGATVVRFPALAIAANDDPGLAQLLAHLGDVDIAIFISPNAVNYGLHRTAAHGGLPARVRIACVGKGSGAALHQALGRGPDLLPSERYDSESLLALPELHQVQGKRVLIFRGRGGRETLAQQLRQRGAQVDYAEVYRRVLPEDDPATLRDALRDGALDIVTVTSNEALANLHTLAGAQYGTALRSLPLVVVSQRGRELAQTLGFHNRIIEARNASDEGLLEAVAHWAMDVGERA